MISYIMIIIMRVNIRYNTIESDYEVHVLSGTTAKCMRSAPDSEGKVQPTV